MYIDERGKNCENEVRKKEIGENIWKWKAKRENGKIKKEGKIKEKNREEVERVEEWTFERVEKEWDGKGRVESKNGERNNFGNESRKEGEEKKE